MRITPSSGYVTGYARGPGTFTFRIKASNGVSPDATSQPATVTVSGDPVTPDPPTILNVTGGNHSATISFNAPYNGGTAITGYTVTASPGGLSQQVSSSPLTVTGLANATAYTFTATATNAVGSSTPSAAWVAVTPAAPPTPAATRLAAAKSSAIRYGGQAVVSAKLTDLASGHPIAGAKVNVLSRSSSSASFARSQR
jgi:hypothetical protein